MFRIQTIQEIKTKDDYREYRYFLNANKYFEDKAKCSTLLKDIEEENQALLTRLNQVREKITSKRNNLDYEACEEENKEYKEIIDKLWALVSLITQLRKVINEIPDNTVDLPDDLYAASEVTLQSLETVISMSLRHTETQRVGKIYRDYDIKLPELPAISPPLTLSVEQHNKLIDIGSMITSYAEALRAKAEQALKEEEEKRQEKNRAIQAEIKQLEDLAQQTVRISQKEPDKSATFGATQTAALKSTVTQDLTPKKAMLAVTEEITFGNMYEYLAEPGEHKQVYDFLEQSSKKLKLFIELSIETFNLIYGNPSIEIKQHSQDATIIWMTEHLLGAYRILLTSNATGISDREELLGESNELGTSFANIVLNAGEPIQLDEAQLKLLQEINTTLLERFERFSENKITQITVPSTVTEENVHTHLLGLTGEKGTEAIHQTVISKMNERIKAGGHITEENVYTYLRRYSTLDDTKRKEVAIICKGFEQKDSVQYGITHLMCCFHALMDGYRASKKYDPEVLREKESEYEKLVNSFNELILQETQSETKDKTIQNPQFNEILKDLIALFEGTLTLKPRVAKSITPPVASLSAPPKPQPHVQQSQQPQQHQHQQHQHQHQQHQHQQHQQHQQQRMDAVTKIVNPEIINHANVREYLEKYLYLSADVRGKVDNVIDNHFNNLFSSSLMDWDLFEYQMYTLNNYLISLTKGCEYQVELGLYETKYKSLCDRSKKIDDKLWAGGKLSHNDITELSDIKKEFINLFKEIRSAALLPKAHETQYHAIQQRKIELKNEIIRVSSQLPKLGKAITIEVPETFLPEQASTYDNGLTLKTKPSLGDSSTYNYIDTGSIKQTKELEEFLKLIQQYNVAVQFQEMMRPVHTLHKQRYIQSPPSTEMYRDSLAGTSESFILYERKKIIQSEPTNSIFSWFKIKANFIEALGTQMWDSLVQKVKDIPSPSPAEQIRSLWMNWFSTTATQRSEHCSSEKEEQEKNTPSSSCSSSRK